MPVGNTDANSQKGEEGREGKGLSLEGNASASPDFGAIVPKFWRILVPTWRIRFLHLVQSFVVRLPAFRFGGAPWPERCGNTKSQGRCGGVACP